MAKKGLIAAVALIGLAACAEGAPKTPVAQAGPADMCGAKALQYLVGRNKSDIPVAVDMKKWRVTCTTCPITMDFSPERLNILYDQATSVVKEVKCG